MLQVSSLKDPYSMQLASLWYLASANQCSAFHLRTYNNPQISPTKGIKHVDGLKLYEIVMLVGGRTPAAVDR